MHDTARYQYLLGLQSPWTVTPVVNSGRHELQPHAAGC